MKACSFLALIALTATSAQADSYRFAKHKAIDENGTGHVAYTYLLPKGWKTVDTIRWTLGQMDDPLLDAFAATSPDGKSTINYINGISHWYTRMPSTSAAKSGGVPPPAHPADVLIANFESQHSGVAYKILENKQQPIASIFRPMATQETSAYRCVLKLEYSREGVPMIVEFGFDYQAYDSGTNWGRQHGFSSGHWYLYNLMSVGAPASDYEKVMRQAVVTLSSQRADPVFFEFAQQVFQRLSQQMMQNTNAQLKARYNQMQQYFKGMSESSKARFQQQQQSKDIATRNMCDFALDRSRWTDGNSVFIVPNTVDRVLSNGSEISVQTGPQYQEIGNWKTLKKID